METELAGDYQRSFYVTKGVAQVRLHGVPAPLHVNCVQQNFSSGVSSRQALEQRLLLSAEMSAGSAGLNGWV